MVILKFTMTINDQQNQYALHLQLKSPWKDSHVGFHCSNFEISRTYQCLLDSFLTPSILRVNNLHWAIPGLHALLLEAPFAVPMLTLLLEWSEEFSPSWIPIRTTSQKSAPNFIEELTAVWNHPGLFNIKNICLELTFGPIFAFIRSQI